MSSHSGPCCTPCVRLAPIVRLVLVAVLLSAFAAADAAAQLCPGTTVVSGLRRPLGMALSNQGNLIVSESGTPVPDSGRLSIVDAGGARRTLIDGLPSALNDVNEPAGPAGIVMRGRTAYLLIGIGDTVLPSPVPGRQLANPDVSSPIFSSVLAIHFSANVEKRTGGFTLSQEDGEALASGETVTLSNGGGDSLTLELVADFPDFVSEPLPGFPALVRGSNPFGLVLVANQLYVTDGGRNLVWRVDVPTGDFEPLAGFPPIANPLFPVGPPVSEAVPTGIEYAGGRLLVTLFRGVPFPPVSSVIEVDPSTGGQSVLIDGLKTAIEIIAEPPPAKGSYLVLQHSSGAGPFFGGPGLLLRFESPGAAPDVLADCLARPTSMVLDDRSGTIYVSELETGRIVAFQ